MTHYRKLTVFSVLLAVVALLTVLAAGASADWFPGDGHKMHFPQLPDPDGWDVFSGPMFNSTDGAIIEKTLADDWRCSETGFVSDVHLWGSWKHDDIGEILGIHLSIHDDVPNTNPLGYSHPGNLLWERDFSATEISIVDPYGTGNQGWFNPNSGEVIRPDHQLFHQINITDIQDPFIQEEGKIYWLDVLVLTEPIQPGTDGPQWGWKTSLDHFNDDAVWGDAPPGATPTFWNELRDPLSSINESLDLAFVITGKPIPEPATCVLLLVGLGAIVTTRRTAC